MSRVDREGPIQRSICAYLTTVLDPKVAQFFAIPNENDGSARMGARLNAQGRKSGVADMCVVSKGIAHFIEVKAEGAYQTKSQKGFQDAITLVGARYAVARSVDDVAEMLEIWGVPTRIRRVRHEGVVS